MQSSFHRGLWASSHIKLFVLFCFIVMHSCTNSQTMLTSGPLIFIELVTVLWEWRLHQWYLILSVFRMLVVRCWYLGFGVLTLLDRSRVGLVSSLGCSSRVVSSSSLQSFHCFIFNWIIIVMLYIVIDELYIPIIFICYLMLIRFIHYSSLFVLIRFVIFFIFMFIFLFHFIIFVLKLFFITIQSCSPNRVE